MAPVLPEQRIEGVGLGLAPMRPGVIDGDHAPNRQDDHRRARAFASPPRTRVSHRRLENQVLSLQPRPALYRA